MMKHTLSVFVALLLNSIVIYAQTNLPGTVKAFCPQVLLQTILTEAEAEALVNSSDYG